MQHVLKNAKESKKKIRKQSKFYCQPFYGLANLLQSSFKGRNLSQTLHLIGLQSQVSIQDGFGKVFFSCYKLTFLFFSSILNLHKIYF